ncbi:MAG: hypothetical protein IPJ71_15450 [Bdellovibrionales bacterium]|nr:hypothetical protein [Bdellovibrionales bacterium]
MGEVQIDVVTDRIATIRYATGLEVQESHIDLSQLVALSPEASRELGLQNVVAYRPLNGGYPIIVLNNSLPRGILNKIPAIFRVGLSRVLGMPAVTIYTGEMSDLKMPLTLYSPKQVSGGKFNKAVAKVEKDLGGIQGIIPRVGLNGRAFSNNACSVLLHTQGNLDSTKTHDY